MKQEIFNFDSGENIFFTSDSHFGHEKIIEFCNRPFSSVGEMDQVLIENWNKVVGPNDYIFHLGDFCFKGSQYWDKILNQLNGHKFLCIGNHDLKNLKDGAMFKFDWVGMQACIQIGDRSVYLNHFPMLCYGGSYRGLKSVYQLHGHVHLRPYGDLSSVSDEEVKEILGKDSIRMMYMQLPTQYDVGVDANNFTPISWDELDSKIKYQMENEKNQIQILQNS